MFFLLRTAFWLSLAFMLMPGDAKRTAAVPHAIAACGQAGAKIVHTFMRTAPRVATAGAKRGHVGSPSQDTLTAGDLAPAWRGPRGDAHKRNGA